MSLTPEETKVLAATNAAIAAGEDPFGDDEPIVRNLPEGEDTGKPSDTTDEDDAGDGQSGTAGKDEPLSAEALAEIANGDQTANLPAPAFNAKVPEDYAAQRKALLAKKNDALKELMDGTIEAEAYAAIENEVATDLEELAAQRIRAETLLEANTQTEAAYQNSQIKLLIKRTADEVDYANDEKARKQFDQSMAILAQDPGSNGMSYLDLINTTHKMVAALRGVTTKAPPAEKTPREERKPDGEAPITLRNLPAAATSNSNGNMIDQIGRLKGPDYEQAFAKLSPQQRRAMLDEED
jgi:hypothetical protein